MRKLRGWYYCLAGAGKLFGGGNADFDGRAM